MSQQQFVARGRARWVAFEAMLSSTEMGRRRNAADLDEFPHLYRLVARDLAVARARQFDAHVVDRLNQLILRAHQKLYTPYRPTWRRFIDFLVRDFPAAVRREARLVGLCHLLFYGAAAGFLLLVLWQPDAVYALIDPYEVRKLEAMYDPAAEHFLRPRPEDQDTAMFGFYIFNNVSIAFRTFASGVLLGVGSLAMLLFNGLFFGAVAGHLANVGFADTLCAFVIGHGSFELTAVCLSATAGLRLGWAVISPGPYSRGAALQRAAHTGVPVLYGSAVMLFIAAGLEAFWSSSVSIPPVVKLGVGCLGWLLVAAYFLWVGPRGH